jgi:hypothetical protein
MPECVVGLAPTITALKKKYPGCSVGLVGGSALREASLLLPELDFFASESEEVQADFTIDLQGTEILEGAAESQDWKAFLQACGSIEQGNPYHLVDLLRKAAQVDNVDVNFELLAPECADELPEALYKGSSLRVSLCGDSLSPEEVESLIEGLSRLSSPVDIFLLGTVKAKRTASQITGKWDGKLSIHDLCGRLGISAISTVLRGCDIHIGGPGLHSLISSGFGTFTICVDNAPTRGPHLYPYGHGHLAIQAATGISTTGSLSTLLHEIIGYALSANSGNVPSLEQWQAFADSKIFEYLGKIRLMATQRIEIVFKESGSYTELYLRPLLFTGSESYDVIQTFYRLLWEHSLNGRTITTYDLQILHQDTTQNLCDLLKPLEQLYELGSFGHTYSGYVRESLASGNLPRAKHESERLQEVEELVHALGVAHPFIAPLCIYHRQRQASMATDNPIALAEEMDSLFSGLQSRVFVMLDLAKSLFHTVFENESTLPAGSPQEGGSNG